MIEDEDSLCSKTRKQNKEFLDTICFFNHKAGKTVIAKYDLSHSPLTLIGNCRDPEEMEQKTAKYLKDRYDFLMFIAKYL